MDDYKDLLAEHVALTRKWRRKARGRPASFEKAFIRSVEASRIYNYIEANPGKLQKWLMADIRRIIKDLRRDFKIKGGDIISERTV